MDVVMVGFAGAMVTVVADALADAHTPLATTARKYVVVVSAPEVYVLLVIAISVLVVKLLTVDNCHLVTVPVCPLKVNSPLVFPVHFSEPPVTVPPTLGGATTILRTCDLEKPV